MAGDGLEERPPKYAQDLDLSNLGMQEDPQKLLQEHRKPSSIDSDDIHSATVIGKPVPASKEVSTELNVDGQISNADYLENPTSRPESSLSHRSKPEHWHPSDRPDPEYVQAVLSPFFHADLSYEYDPTVAQLRLKRAFHQQD